MEDRHIRLIPFGTMPLNQLLMSCHMLITDYSSVCWDMLYQNKPTLFYQFDLDQYNEAHGITPQTIQKSVRDLIAISKKVAADENALDKDPESMSKKELEKHIADIEKKMKKAAAELNFEAAAEYRDKLIMLKNTLRDVK